MKNKLEKHCNYQFEKDKNESWEGSNHTYYSLSIQGSPQAPRSTSKSFLRKHSRSGSPVRDRPGSARSVAASQNKPSVPRESPQLAKVTFTSKE